MPAIFAIAQTDLILSVPRRLAKMTAAMAGVRIDDTISSKDTLFGRATWMNNINYDNTPAAAIENPDSLARCRRRPAPLAAIPSSRPPGGTWTFLCSKTLPKETTLQLRAEFFNLFGNGHGLH